VYVGFDNGDDLGMKGGDSAMPIWADFMKGALAMHPEWNGDWAMPVGVKKAEIDIRDVKVIKEITGPDALSIRDDENKTARDANDTSATAGDGLPVSDVPAEFRRVELFISGTIPTKALAEPEDVPLEETDIPAEPGPSLSPTGTPLTGTWQDGIEGEPAGPPVHKQPQNTKERTVSVMICPVTGMRATANCPEKVLKSFKAGTEPKDFCTFHVGK
jgi:hypothetical protein